MRSHLAAPVVHLHGVVGFTAGLLRTITIGVLQSLGLTLVSKLKTDKGPGHFCAGLQWIREITGVRGCMADAAFQGQLWR